MAKLGFDFGTTYSAVCIYDPVTQRTDFLKFDNCALEFFPTLIAYGKKNGARYIGHAARRWARLSSYDSYDLFKLSMGEDAHEANGRERTPYAAAKDFIGEMLGKYCVNRGVPLSDITLVQAVPEAWKNEEKSRSAMDHLTQMYQELGLDVDRQVSFESEPVSAAVYYLNEICRGKYHGYIVVIDYGGGTLDLTLCRAEENGSVSVLHSCGNSGSGTIGCAGSAFDDAVARRLAERCASEERTYAPGTKAFDKLKAAFEEAKIASQDSTDKALRAYYESAGFDDGIAFTFPVLFTEEEEEEFTVYASDIAKAFESVNQPVLTQSIRQIQAKYLELNPEDTAFNQIQVLMVGGFSNLYCVESCARQMFLSMDGVEDPRFDARMGRDSRSTAIAHGACMIAAGITPVEYINPMEVGFYAFDPRTRSEIAVPVLERGVAMKTYAKPHFCRHHICLDVSRPSVNLRLYFDAGDGQTAIRMDETFRELCPNQEEGGVYLIGFSIDRHRVPHIHIREKNSGAENIVSLYRMMTDSFKAQIAEETNCEGNA